MSSKKKSNGFLMFMLEYRRTEEQNGNRIDMNEAQLKAGEIWIAMTASERAPYNEMSSKPTPTVQSSTGGDKFTCFGVSFEEIDRQEMEAKRNTRNMELEIEEMLLTAQNNNTLMSLTFNFFSTSYFVQTLTSSIFPAELALLKFNLTDGNYEDMSILVNPGDLPMGMAAEAKNHSEKTHKRSLPPNTDGETDYKKIFAQMMNFLGCYEKDQKTPPLFVESGMKEENLKVAKLTLKLIAEKVGEDLNCFRVLPIEVLLFKLNKMRAMSNKNFKEYSAKPFNSILIAKEMVARDDFLYYDIGCDFHREHNISHHCCLAKVRRHGFTISQYCLDDKRDKKIPGRHFPYNHATTDDSASSSNFSGVGWKSKKTMSDSFKEFRMRFCGRSSIVTSGRSTPLTSGLTTSDVPSERHSMRYAESVASEYPTVKEAEQSDVAEDENDVEVAKLMGNLTTQAVPADPSDVLSTASTSAQSFQYEQLKNEESSNGSRRPILTADISFETISASFSSGVPTNLWFLRRGSRNMLPRRGRP